MKTKTFFFIMIVSLIIVTYSCETDSNYTTNDQIENKWNLLGFLHNDINVEEMIPDNLNGMNIEFSDSNRFHAVSSCNVFDGYYAVSDPDLIEIDSIATTLIYCTNDIIRNWEENYFNNLNNASNYRIRRNRLTIETTSNITIIFEAD